jgi:membrane-associated phospholipid phosphatase
VDLVQQLSSIDVTLSEEVVDLRWKPLTSLMLLASAWWVKDLLGIVATALVALRRRQLPWPVLLVAVSTLLAAVGGNLLKGVFDRERPFAQGLWSGLGALPHSSSMPSGHACTAFGAATAVALVCPRLRVPAISVAVLVCVSRVYLGVHFLSDVLVGAFIGASIAALVVITGRHMLPSGHSHTFER